MVRTQLRWLFIWRAGASAQSGVQEAGYGPAGSCPASHAIGVIFVSFDKNRPRLLVLASTYPRWAKDHEPGFVHELSKRMSRDFEVTVLCPHAPGAATRELLDGVRILRYRYAPVRLERLVNDGGIVANLKRHPWMLALIPGFLLGQALWIWRLGHRSRCDVIHAHWLLPQGMLVACLQALGRNLAPFLVTAHGADLFALRGRVFTILKRFVLRRASSVTVVSAALRDAIVMLGVDVERVEVEPMGVDLVYRFTPDSAVRRKPGRLLFVGRLVEKKGLRYLIDALPEIKALVPEAHLQIAGFGPDQLSLCRQAEALGVSDSVHFLGPIEQGELPTLYRSAAVFVAPFIEASTGDQEGLGLVVVEALGCGTPIVVGSVPAVREVLGELGASVEVDSRNVKELSDAVSFRLSVPEAALREALLIRGDVIRRFDWQMVACRYADQLRALSEKS